MENFYSRNKPFDISILKKFTSNDDFAIINEKMSKFQFKRGQELLQQGTNPIGTYWITSGIVKTIKALNTKQHLLRLHKADEIVAYECILSGRKHPYTIEAVTEVEAYIIPKEVFLKVIDQNRELTEQLLIIVSNDLLEIEDRFMNIVYKTASARIADTLLELQHFLSNDHQFPQDTIKMLYNRESLAGIAGTTRETVIRILSDFNKEGIIEINGKTIKVLNKKKLKNISQDI